MMTPSIQMSDPLPHAEFKTIVNGNIQTVDSTEFFAGETTLVIGVVGAFTPVCTRKHFVEFIPYAKELTKNWLVNKVACISVADPFVLKAWAAELGVGDDITMLTDTNAVFTKKMGLDLDLSFFGLGTRSNRYVMLVRDCNLVELKVEEKFQDVIVTSQTAVASWIKQFVGER